MNDGKSTNNIIYELLIFLLWNPSKMKYPIFFTDEWVHIVEKKQCLICCIEIVNIGYSKVISSKSFSLARLWRLQSKMKCNSFSLLLDEQCWHILFRDAVFTGFKSLCCECKESREYHKWSIKRRYSNKHLTYVILSIYPSVFSL